MDPTSRSAKIIRMLALNKSLKEKLKNTPRERKQLLPSASTSSDPDYIPNCENSSASENNSNSEEERNKSAVENSIQVQTFIDNASATVVAAKVPQEVYPAANPAGHTDIQYTKKGTRRKRKKYELSVKERKRQKLSELVDKHSVKVACQETCKKRCILKIPEDRRIFLNGEYWKLKTAEGRRAFLLHHTSQHQVKQRTAAGQTDTGVYRRNNSYKYILKDDTGTIQEVCQVFFLATLGYSKGNNKVLKNVQKSSNNSVAPAGDARGKEEPHNKIDDTIIRQHITSYNPTISHYRRSHAPNRLYLPSDLSFMSMHQDFVAKNPNYKCSYEKYRVVAKTMNISIVKLGHEECENCEEFELHDPNHNKTNLDENCDECKKWKTHIQRAERSREKYRQDAEQLTEGDHSITYCADLQKVVMLPRLEMFKTAIFTNRLTVYNESFVPVGKKQKECKPFAVLWHEALFGRNKEQLISAFYNFLKSKRDVLTINMWLDNCAAQNKNWSFFSFLIYMVNSNEITTETITIKYFEPGHTFMAADSFHHSVELSMKKKGKLYDFQDFVDSVKQSTSKTEVLPMELNNFYAWEDYSSQYKLKKIEPRPYLHNMVQVTVHRGSHNMIYKNEFNGDSFEINILNAKITKNSVLPSPKQCIEVTGISSQKKENILKNLGGIMKNRLRFWEDLPVSK